MNIFCNSEKDLVPAAERLIDLYPDARVFAFYGKMGSGKTTFIKAICRVLGVREVVQSPSFAIINEYRLDDNMGVYHFDFYRIKKQEEALDIGYEDYFYSGNYCFIEWPELIEPLLPEGTVCVTISGEEGRTIDF